MFRNPRENSSPSIETPLKPSTGRPPTPPNGTGTPHPPAMASRSSAKPLTPRPNSQANTLANKQSTKKVIPLKAVGKTPGKPNASILNFFKKVDSPLKDESIFLSQGTESKVPDRPRLPSPEVNIEVNDSDGLYDGCDRYNEVVAAVKRRKISNGSITSSCMEGDEDTMGPAASAVPGKACSPPPPEKSKRALYKSKRKGPFLSDSDTDEDASNDFGNEAVQKYVLRTQKKDIDYAGCQQLEDMNESVETSPIRQVDIKEHRPAATVVASVEPADRDQKRRKRVPIAEAQAKWDALQPKTPSPPLTLPAVTAPDQDSIPKSTEKRSSPVKETIIPTLKKEYTSIDDWGKFEDFDEFADDGFGDGEEAVERRWMEEQAILEAADGGLEEEFEGFPDDDLPEPPKEVSTASCPICDANLGGISPDDASKHVNGCLDGDPIPLPNVLKKDALEAKLLPPEASNRFSRKAAIPRPGQANPFQIGSDESTASNVFSKLMSGKAEDAAWASAAAAENASRGKPAYQRTCPFYKIMPGFFICVDAFRYGAVQGCNAYFLSHFHSDHYIGLTSSWCHGPIYCSKVTANLVKQQLRVDPRYVVALDFEDRVEVSGTQGVAVTMIPANHCPGSSLFLFEKVIGKGANPKVQRVLHCGDFRACPAHIAHPLLMPDIVDSITGKTKQQKIDVCYLDTTYLNPRYAFPSQENVVRSCADMCVSLRKERAEESDAWEVVKRERAGTGMAKFVSTSVKAEDDSIAMEIGSKKTRGRLLVVCGTYSIGKERICMGIARALDCKIWAPPGKMRICAALEDPELMSRMTDDPREAQIHMQMLMEIRPETLQEYLNSYKPHFSRVVGFRPSGWNYRPPNSRFTDSPSIPTVLHSDNWKSRYTMAELVPQRGSTREASCFGVPYSEHSSFRELTMFVCALRIEKVIPTVNVGSAAGRAKMKAWIERWLAERRKNGCIKLGEGEGEVRW
ncbi:DNA cross-link repair pso2 snm1 [Hyphodiscus hymeniophilus]|uniref:DNA cross-link repair pso2 snm1 n=1 Tax=Hyphodiscus hymeniophilus TaxID=353542 RepID=A0A9P6VH04_9HELO|nr:DNA cross-link repair pso2 snm1 [Hyphodiscus hymeniophilus]